jgi:hypothetical protein
VIHPKENKKGIERWEEKDRYERRKLIRETNKNIVAETAK